MNKTITSFLLLSYAILILAACFFLRSSLLSLPSHPTAVRLTPTSVRMAHALKEASVSAMMVTKEIPVKLKSLMAKLSKPMKCQTALLQAQV